MQSTTHLNRDDDSQLRSEQQTAVHPTVVAPGRETCSNCGAAMAADQRYCVECGQRHGAPRLPFMEGAAQHTYEIQAPPPVARARLLTTNGTLIAGIGTLLLAMGIGVLIGRTGNNGSNRAANPVQVVSVAGGVGGPTGAAGSGTASSSTSTTSSTPQAALAAGAKTAKATHTSTTGTFKTKAPPPKVVTVGSPGSGRGYQNGKFTGNFFGP